MADQEKTTVTDAEQVEETTNVTEEATVEETPVDTAAQQLAAAEDKYLRLAAEYDNYRKRTAKEKESAWTEAKAQTVAAFLPVYDNLERALKQEIGRAHV